MVKNDDAAIRLRDWDEADRMVDEILLNKLEDVVLLKERLHLGIGRMVDGNMPFDDDSFHEMLENAFFPADDIPFFLFDKPRDIQSILSEDMNTHPIDRFQELLSFMQMHPRNSRIQTRTVWHAHELMKRHHIAEYDDMEEAGTSLYSLYSLVRNARSDDEIILKAKTFDVIMQSCSDDIDLRNRMLGLAFPFMPTNEDAAETMLAATRSYFTHEPDYRAALSILDDSMTGMEPNMEIDMSAFGDILKSCGADMGAMSGFMHASIVFDKMDRYYESPTLSFDENTYDFIHPNAMRLMLANLAEGYPIEYITELIASEGE